ncbi:MAG: endonuclease III domain-containing protein [Lentisphaerae bacterium]|jgi:endonuclease III related protein|nr:endonuclease III domain-containing protein [Lentisphaerota bacterium]MBT4822920.1 endonuclease III domain-containing protein [Lentisphaerota bacterium]MBT5609769.1 endonuclease III domain-containing protein [Lentisphaerota bacterium]MBT7061411.1 endonuclease III domain-containing protein [Lentisphaerota bacterium]MBT7845101.1 endonuclease III domain-containing protein [Lentisphaerota bacterium]
MLTPTTIFEVLLAAYGPQGWWPVGVGEGDGRAAAYHPLDFAVPRTDSERFEICVGAILTQNTAWRNVEKALVSLHAAGGVQPSALLRMPDQQLADAIRPSGYFNVKSRRLRVFTEFYLLLAGSAPTREELLKVWGVGPETADSMLLYAYGRLHMVIDAYTRRIFSHLGVISETATYDDVASVCEAELPRDVPVYQEMHALLVAHAKRYYQRLPYDDPLFPQVSSETNRKNEV